MESKIVTKWDKESADYKQYAEIYANKEVAAATKLIAGNTEFPFELVIGLDFGNLPVVEVHSAGRIEKISNVIAGINGGQFTVK